VSFLLDTHAFFWLSHPARQVPARLEKRLTHDSDGVYVSAVSAFEVSMKVALGKFDDAVALTERWVDAVRELGAEQLPLDTRHALAAGSLDWSHRDPFDRLLAAQAIAEGLTLVTADRAFQGAPGLVVQPW